MPEAEQREYRAAAAGEESAAARTLLRERARELARPPAPPEEGERLEVIEFRLGRERLAFESAWVREVFTAGRIVAVPGTPDFIAGVVNLRGNVLSLLDLGRLLALAETEVEAKKPVVLLLAGEGTEFGVLAERVEGAREILRQYLAPPPATLPEAVRPFQRGVLPGAVTLLDARHLLAAPQLRVDQSA